MAPFALLLLAATLQPDRTPLADEWGYRPADSSTVRVNPPAFSWVLEKGAKHYDVQWADNPQFNREQHAAELKYTVYTHNKPFTPGKWYWRYRINDGAWSRTRSFTIPPNTPEFPQPTLEELRSRIPTDHPRLFVHREELPKLREYAKSDAGKAAWAKLVRQADALLKAGKPTPEPSVMGNSKNPETRDHWWSNRVQTVKALNEAEVLTFVWLMTQDRRYAEPARQFTLTLARWNPDGPTNFTVNCEAAKPMLHRLARAYDWAYDLFNKDERREIRAMMLRRANDAWKSGEVREGVGHLNQPFNSHANRTWHKLAENAIATLNETPESDQFLQYAVTKFFGAYPVWSDDDGGWHEGLSYLSGYMVKTRWWMHLATQLGLEPFRNPFFARVGDYAMYSDPPGTPDEGFGDLSSRPPGNGFAFLHYFAKASHNQAWTWWLREWKVPEEGGEPVLDFLWSTLPKVEPKAPSALPPSRLFAGTGVAVMNSNLLDGLANVQVRFKASPMGRVSHGHDPHNSFTLNAYGEALLVNNVYRDIYGSPFHKDWAWSTASQNAVLVNGEGQKPHSADLGGQILKHEFQPGFDYLTGDATASYEGRLTRARRHVLFIKPGLIVIADDLAAPAPSTFQIMLHGQQEFTLDDAKQHLTLNRSKAGVQVDYVSPEPLKLRQWTGYTPPPDKAYLDSIGNTAGIPAQWHVEAGTSAKSASAFLVTVIRVHKGAGPVPASQTMRVARSGKSLKLTSPDASIALDSRGATVKQGRRTWRVRFPD